ncbi:hypothetical protein N8563_00625 [bacterium]|nr:hypothetical protein [bacterium]
MPSPPLLPNANNQGVSLFMSHYPAFARDRYIGISNFYLVLLVLGVVFNTFSYQSVFPVFTAIIFYIIGFAILRLPSISGFPEKTLFNRIYIISFFMAGVAAIYANQFSDINQTLKDAGNFVYFSTIGATGLPINEIYLMTDGSLMVKIWSIIYDFFSLFGFPKEPYIGISVNALIICFTGVIGIKIIRLLFGFDQYRFQQFTLFYSCSGIIWLMSSTHLRDSVSLFVCTILLFIWINFLIDFRLDLRLVLPLVATLFAIFIFPYIRQEFSFVPLALCFSAYLSVLFSNPSHSIHRKSRIYFLLFGAILAITLLFAYFSKISFLFNYAQLAYLDNALLHSSDTSLAMSLIVNQPILIRVLFGSIYLFVFPIPFWSGIQFEQVMPLFKSFNAIFSYFLFPLFLTAIYQLFCTSSLRTSSILFLLFSSIGFTFAVAGTSLELRHLANFLVPILILATLPDLRIPAIRNTYNLFLFSTLFFIIVIHLAWITLKFII